MTIIQAIYFGIIQGAAEFLPISSSGHLNLAQYFSKFTPSLGFDIFLNTATLLSVLFFFRKKIPYFFKNLLFIIIGTIPAAVIGVIFKHKFESIFADIHLLPYFFLITSIYMLVSAKLKRSDKKMTINKAIIIGLFQAVAILPGVSRAGSTIFAGLLLGLSPVEAFDFSFSLFIPASLGAIALGLKDMSGFSLASPAYILCFLITMITGIFALSFLKKVLISNKLWYFGIYTGILAIVSFVFLNILPIVR
jgi:undecaprenyl-diphosphatase